MRIPRRKFLAGALSGAGFVVANSVARASGAPCPPSGLLIDGLASSDSTQPCTGPVDMTGLLQPNDFAYLGLYRIPAFPYMFGFTVRRYGDEVRFISRAYGFGFNEWSTRGRSYGETLPQVREWKLEGQLNTNAGRHEAIYWDPALDRLWFIQAVDYPDGSVPSAGYYPTYIALCSLPDSAASIANVARISLEGVADRKIHTGVTPVPQAAQSAYGIGPYAAGFGGYASRMNAGGGAVLNLSLYGLPDPRPYLANAPRAALTDYNTPGSIIPAGQYQRICTPDSSSVRGIRIWHGYAFTPDGGARPLRDGGTVPTGRFAPLPGKTIYGPLNYLEGAAVAAGPSNGQAGEVPPNYVTTVAPGPSSWWSPRPDPGRYWSGQKVAYFGWDKYVGATWIQTPSKRGFVAVAGVGGGRSYYISSAGYCDRAAAEIHLFNPDDLGALRRGSLPGGIAGLRPYAMKHLPETEWGDSFTSSDTFNHHVAAYDAGPYPDGRGRLYVFMNRAGDRKGDDSCHVHVYAVSS